MRVVAGTAGGLPLFVPRTELRPTMDIVKSAIFSSLGDAITGARVLDLFAGTGALGIEALSRGAKSVVFVDNASAAVAAIKRNLERTRLEGTVCEMDIFRYLDRLPPTERFEVAFADPPYQKKSGERSFSPELLASPALHRALAPDGILVLEHLPGEKLVFRGKWESLREKRYGATAVAFLRAAAHEN